MAVWGFEFQDEGHAPPSGALESPALKKHSTQTKSTRKIVKLFLLFIIIIISLSHDKLYWTYEEYDDLILVLCHVC
jgi:hypothetical protein